MDAGIRIRSGHRPPGLVVGSVVVHVVQIFLPVPPRLSTAQRRTTISNHAGSGR